MPFWGSKKNKKAKEPPAPPSPGSNNAAEPMPGQEELERLFEQTLVRLVQLCDHSPLRSALTKRALVVAQEDMALPVKVRPNMRSLPNDAKWDMILQQRARDKEADPSLIIAKLDSSVKSLQDLRVHVCWPLLAVAAAAAALQVLCHECVSDSPSHCGACTHRLAAPQRSGSRRSSMLKGWTRCILLFTCWTMIEGR